jgi:hypothetical protein
MYSASGYLEEDRPRFSTNSRFLTRPLPGKHILGSTTIVSSQPPHPLRPLVTLTEAYAKVTHNILRVPLTTGETTKTTFHHHL